jgi:VIT1/CCC1 family predicted Fe2+/Mn2+ transporter
MNPAESLEGELTAAYLYRVVAECEPEPRKKRLFMQLANEAEQQAKHWQRALVAQGAPAPAFAPPLRARLIAWLVRLLGPQRLTHALAAMKVRGMAVYRSAGYQGAITTAGARALPSPHDEIGEQHGVDGKDGSAAAAGSLRAAVFGVNDGLVSNTSLILGVAGGGADARGILLAGIAGLVAGAFSMAAGEWVSVRSQREMFEHQIALEKAELDEYPEEEAGELAMIFEARGMNQEEAQHSADHLIAEPRRALDALTREELGLNPGDLGSPLRAALASFFSFAIGSAIPLLPFLSGAGTRAVPIAIGLSGAALLAVGASLSLFTGRPALAGALRMLAIGAAAGALTWGIGSLLGVSLA